jgi:cytochrome c biogenesis protein CcmG, thiol:disulfide interchange protein DsbE
MREMMNIKNSLQAHRRGRYCALAMAIAMALASGAMSIDAQALEVGSALPVTGLQSDGRVLDVAQLKGKLVYVDFWASWCGPCKQSFPWMNEMHAKYAARGLEIVAINVDAKVESAQTFLSSAPAKFTVAFDTKGETPKQFGVKAMPTSYLFGADGKVVLVHSGFRDSDRAALEAAIVAALPTAKK